MRVCFVVPAHGRLQLTRICLTRLADVCADLDAAAVVVACDENLNTAREHGFHTIVRDNRLLGCRFNDGFTFASIQADYVMPLGSDDLITANLVRRMIAAHQAVGAPEEMLACTKMMSAVAPTGREIATLRVPYEGGAGPRLFPSALLSRVGGRPVEETRTRGIDTSALRRLKAIARIRFIEVDSDPLELVDVKTEGANLNTFEMLLPYAIARHTNPWELLATVHPASTVDAVRRLYS